MEVRQCNDYIKETLETYCRSCNPDSAFKVPVKYVIHISEDEFADLNKSKLEYSISITQLRFAIIDINSKKHLVVVGSSNLLVENDCFTPVFINNVIFLSIAKSLNLNIREGILEADILDSIYPIEEENVGYDVENVAKLFESFMVYEVPEQEVKREHQIKTHIAKILLANQKYLYLPFTSNTINSYVQYYNKSRYDDNIFNSSLAYCWRYCFLDVYRCIEPIFRHLPLSGLKQEISFQDSIDILYEKIYNHCGWRPQETSSMETLFTDQYISEELLQKLRATNIGDSPDENIGKSIYKLRNKIVHHQGFSANIECLLTEEKWNELIGLLIDSLVELRQKIPYDS